MGLRLFGTDGVRGTANTELSPLLASKLGSSSALVLRRKHNDAKILIGRDTRISGDLLESALAAGICSMGVDIYLVGIIPTPGVAYLTRMINADAGVVISASHNPMKDNGIKFFGPDGYKLPDDMEKEIENNIDGFEDFHRPSGAGIGRMYRVHDLCADYVNYIQSTFPYRLDGFKIAIDCSNGSFSEFAPRLLSSLGAELVVINADPNGININDRCGSLYPAGLQEAVTSSNANIGIAFDGDGDRAILVDEKGRIVDGDRVMALTAIHKKKHDDLPNNAVVATVMSNMGLEAALASNGINLVRTKVGDRYVAEEMVKTGISIGGEKSGHIIFSDYSTTGDGMITALQVLRVMIEDGKPLSQLADQMTEFPQVLLNIPVRNKDGWEKVPSIMDAIKRGEQMLAGNGRIYVRASGTESIIRVMAEGPNLPELEEIAGSVAAVLKEELG